MRRPRRRRRALPKKTSKTKFDKNLVLLTLFLTILGVIAVADASAPQALSVFSDPYYFAKQQLMWAIIGFTGLIVAALTPYKVWKKLAPLFFIITIVLLIAVLIPGLGSRVLGARRWISLGPLSFQPSEIVKFSLAAFIAFLVDRDAALWKIIGSLGLMAGLIMLQPDLGTTIVVILVGFTQLFISGVNIFKMALFGLSGGALASLAIFTSSYRRARLMTFFQSSQDPLGSSYQIRQILIAIGSGGFFGVGVGQSRQKYLFLPETATDSVFAIIAEETGFIGAAAVIILLTILSLKLVKIAKNAPDTFSKVFASGIAAWVGGQTIVNISSMVSLTPLTGIPLPFFSYGGTSLTMLLVSVGVLLNISRYNDSNAKQS